MTEILSQVTAKGQITVPAELRRLWGLTEGDRVAFVIDGDIVRLLPHRGTVVARTAGALRKYSQGQPLIPEQLREAFEEAIVADYRPSQTEE